MLSLRFTPIKHGKKKPTIGGKRILKYYKYTDKERKQIVKSIVVLVDTREKANSHVLDFFDEKGIAHRAKALPHGDYSFMVPANPALNIERDLYFHNEIMVERKNSASELATNFSTHRARFQEEFATFPGKKYLLLENSCYDDIANGSYRSQLSPQAFLSSLHAFNNRYGLEVVYMPNDNFSGLWLYNTFACHLRGKMNK